MSTTQTSTDPTQDPAVVYHPGLEGVIAGESAICQVHAEAVLLYRGYDVHELAGKVPFESVAWLLLHDDLPTDEQRKEIERDLRSSLKLPEPIVQVLRLLPKEIHPMDSLRTAVSASAGWEKQVTDNSHDANVAKAIRLCGVINAATAAGHRLRYGQAPVGPSSELSLAGNFLYMLEGKKPENWRAHALDTIHTLYAEHDFNASTFTARVIASTLADMHCAITGAIGALKGPLHGGANEQAMNVLREVGKPENAENWLKGKLQRKELIMGFGHRVYKKGDSRVPILRGMTRIAGKQTGETQWVEIGEALEAAMMKEKGIPANADLYAAPLFHLLKIPTDLNTPLFACSRVIGWAAHVIEQQDKNRLIRPRSRYTGPARRSAQ